VRNLAYIPEIEPDFFCLNCRDGNGQHTSLNQHGRCERGDSDALVDLHAHQPPPEEPQLELDIVCTANLIGANSTI
jgi:hypothetical protein